MKVKLGTVIKDITNEKDLGDYLDAGWQLVQEDREIKEKIDREK